MFVKIKRIAAIILAVLMLASVMTGCKKSDVPDGYQLIACEGDEFRLYVPTQGWMPNVSGGVTSAFFSLDENSSVSVFKADDAGEMTLDEYWELCNEKYASELEEYKLEGTEKAVLGGQAAKKAVYSAKQTVGGAEEIYKYMQVMAKYKGETYILLYSAPEKHYDSHIEEIEGNADGAGVIPYFKFAEPYSPEENKEFSDKVTAPDGMKLISTDERAYRFFVPENWIVNQRAESTAAYFSETDRSNVSVQMYMTADESQTVDEYFASCEETYKKNFSAYEHVSSDEIEMSGLCAGQYVMTMTSGGVEYKMLQAIVKKGAMFYVVTYTAIPENYDGHISDVEKMIESFEIR